MTELNAQYWQERWSTRQTGWDIGHANHGLIHEVKSRFPTNAKILIPGAGRGHEAEALWSAGYLNTYVCDWAPEAFDALRESEVLAKAFQNEADAKARLIVSDFFTFTGSFDLILEQTFFCAIDPGLRKKYVHHAHTLLKPVGKWLGIFFDCHFPTAGPPFGGDRDEYIELFTEAFEIQHLERFEGSISPRKGKELLGLMHCKSV